jgi:hypothetical protein
MENITRKVKIGVTESVGDKNTLLLCRRFNVRERILRWLFGELRRVTIIIPNDHINDITIQETLDKRGINDGAE